MIYKKHIIQPSDITNGELGKIRILGSHGSYENKYIDYVLFLEDEFETSFHYLIVDRKHERSQTTKTFSDAVKIYNEYSYPPD